MAAETSPIPTDGAGLTEADELRRQLWEARDAARGATAELGNLRSKVKELEVLIHQLRVRNRELDDPGLKVATRQMAKSAVRAVRRRLG